MKVVMFIAGLVALGALAGAFDMGDVSERRFDLIAALIAAAVLGGAVLIDRTRSRLPAAKVSNRQVETMLLYAIAIPAAVYWVFATTFELGPDGKGMLGTVVGLGGLGLAMWRWERGD